MLRTSKLAIWLFISMLATTLALGISNTVHRLSDRDNRIARDVDAVFIKDAPIVDESDE
ncbi:uncharacterized protein GGS22DRAFT_192345 [Annulohypoxylon maeteangense]|uniref:uncharacterized protein n=1 Tax=Annulohypoxylon maeteangense TaxID=1927788 RepID=UPI0020084528|nr:uncharacterized protein GGS22DRAFT_192345 [Annulohypoxylon maeteangense]KAI0881258.1 hypothetical protein GGS22DRAFT_192345 [Annulohypoxylon maeteangense]